MSATIREALRNLIYVVSKTDNTLTSTYDVSSAIRTAESALLGEDNTPAANGNTPISPILRETVAFQGSVEHVWKRFGLTKREEFAKTIMGGFASNPAVFAANGQCGWAIVNCTEAQLADYAVGLADTLLAELAKARQ